MTAPFIEARADCAMMASALAEPAGPTTVATERLALTSLEHHLERRLRSAALL